MNRRVSMAAALGVSLLAGTARADLTVFYATDGPTGPMVASLGGRAPEPTPSEPTTAAARLPERPAPREIRFIRVGDGSGDQARLVLLDASGAPDPRALDQLSILARPRGTSAPSDLSHTDTGDVAPGVRRLHPALLLRLASLADRFPDRGIEIVSGYRPDAREGSRHRHGRALDLRVQGESTDDVRAFLEAQAETGVGFYPTSGFVHVDIRARSVHWVDRSGPGEAPAIVREGDPDPGAVEDARRMIDALDVDLGLDLD